MLKSLRNAEETYKVRHKKYAGLDALKADGSSPVGEGEVEANSGCTFRSTVKGDCYTIIAVPPHADETTYTLTETGRITP